MLTFLGARTHFSLGESTLSPKEVVTQAKAAGYTAVALADTMTISSAIAFASECEKVEIRGIIGCRLRIVANPTYRPPTKKEQKAGAIELPNPRYFLNVYARTEAGFKAIIRLLSKGYSTDYFYKLPRIGLDDLLAELDGDSLIVTTGDQWGLWSLPDPSDTDKAAVEAHGWTLLGAREIADKIVAKHGTTLFYVDLVAVNAPYFARLAQIAVKQAEALCLPAFLTRPAYYDEGKAESLTVLGAIIGRSTMKDGWTKHPWSQDLHLAGPNKVLREAIDMLNLIKAHYDPAIFGKMFSAAAANNGKILDVVEYEWKKMPVSLPKMAEDEYGELVRLCQEGWKTRFAEPVWGHKPDTAELATAYIERLKFELATLKRMGFSGYFLLVSDLVRWSKSQNILVGPGRGSVGGSLVAYLVGITDVDPIRFNLLFERFINPERLDLPDADLDFMSARRDEVIKYIEATYGEMNVAGISNYTQMQAAGALRDVARVCGVEMSAIAASKLVPKEHGKPVSLEEAAKVVPELEKLRAEHPKLWALAEGLEGVMRSYGRHAAGVVVAGEPLINRAIIETRGDARTINWDKWFVEDTGLVKMDILGLTTLDVFDLALRNIFKRHGKKIDLTRLPLDDAKVLDAFGKGETVGVFQFESSGMRKLLKDLAMGGPLTFEDLSAATALYRPGPMDSGLMDDYVSIKQGIGSPSYEHPNMVAALQATYSVLIYQEQVMQVARDLCGFTFAEADKLRKAMGKKLPEEMKKYREVFVDGAVKTSGMDPKRAEILFDKIELFAGYAFNRSHSVEYSLISYGAMWLKTYYPLEFYAAALSVLGEDKLPLLVSDMGLRGIKLMPPDINHSTGVFEVLDERTLLIPFTRIKGCSDNTTRVILEARIGGRFANKDDFLARVNKTKCNSGHQEKLDKVGAFAAIETSQPGPLDPVRLRDQHELLPGLVLTAARVERTIDLSATMLLGWKAVSAECAACGKCDLSGGVHPAPRIGKTPKFLVINPYPMYSEEKAGKLMEGSSANPTKIALDAAGLSLNDGYWTTLVKSPKPKTAQSLTNAQINACTPYLERELELVKPPVIVALGSPVVRWLLKDVKGSVEELAGKVVYDKVRDTNIVCGISPGMVGMQPSKQSLMDETFRRVAELVL